LVGSNVPYPLFREARILVFLPDIGKY